MICCFFYQVSHQKKIDTSLDLDELFLFSLCKMINIVRLFVFLNQILVILKATLPTETCLWTCFLLFAMERARKYDLIRALCNLIGAVDFDDCWWAIFSCAVTCVPFMYMLENEVQVQAFVA